MSLTRLSRRSSILIDRYVTSVNKILYIIGKGGHARVVAEAASLCGWGVRHIVPEAPCDPDDIEESHFLAKWEKSAVASLSLVCGVGSTGRQHARRKILSQYESLAACFKSIIHPRAHVAQSASIGIGVFIAQGAQVSSEACINDHAIINTGCVIDHESIVGRGAHIAPGAVISGGVVCGDFVHVGVGATIIQGITLAAGVVIGAGAVVTKSIEQPDSLWVGVPARFASKK